MKSNYELELEQMVGKAPADGPGLWDQFATGFHSERRENLPIVSRMIADTAADQKADRILLEAVENEQIPHSVIDAYSRLGKVDYEGAMRYLQDQNINTEFGVDDYIKERDAEYEAARLSDQSVFDRQSGLGMMSEMAGRMAATFTDPLYLATLPIGIGTANTILSAGLRTAALAAGTEVLAVPFIWDFKTDIGADYGKGDAIRHLATATAGGFAFGAGGKALGKLIKRAQTTMSGVTEEGIEEMSAASNKMQDATIKVEDIPDTIVDTTPEFKRGAEVVGAEQVTFAERMGEITQERQRVADVKLQKARQIEAIDELIEGTLTPLMKERSALKQARSVLKDTPEAAIDRQLIDDALEAIQKAVDEADIPAMARARASLYDAREAVEFALPERKMVDETIEQMDEIIAKPKVEEEVVGTDYQAPAKEQEPFVVAEQYKDLSSVQEAQKVMADEKNLMDALQQEPCKI